MNRRTTTLPMHAALLMGIFLANPAAALTATFDDLGLTTVAPGSFLDPPTSGGSFTSGGITFLNDGSFSGFSASTTMDSTTPGFGNQYSNITGSGTGGSAGFGIAFSDSTIVLSTPRTVLGAEFTNTTYAALSMRDGDAIDDLGGSTGFVELMLADYRFADGALDFILDQWVFLDLTGLGIVSELRFGFESSDVGTFGINTPTYFAIDNLVTAPEPGLTLLLGLGLAALASGRRTNSTA